jgi:CRISPR-associated protein Csb2
MFALRVTYLMGRVYSAAFDDGDDKREPEWPPHPSRLFSALVAAWGDSGADQDLKRGLEWIENQGAPTIFAGDFTARMLVQAFVPVNDASTLPEDRTRKPRTFPSATLSTPEVYFVWDSAPPSDVLPAIERILERTSSLGHSSSLVSMEIVDQIPDGQWTVWAPDAPAGLRLRIPYPDRLMELVKQYERFKTDPNKVNRPSRGKTTLYAPLTRPAREAPQCVFDQMIVLRRDAGPRASLRSALSVVSSFRNAVLKLAPQPVAEYLSGHAPESTPENPVRSERSHVSLVPLPFVGAPHATGDLMGVAALLPATLTNKERAICWDVVSKIENLQMPWGRWEVSVADAEENRRALLPDTWTRPHDLWATVTPFVFDRYPKDPYGEEAERIVREAFLRVGLPEPREVVLHYNPWHIGVPKASAFPAAAARPGKPQRYHCHVLARWARPIRGPVVAGAGRYYGYGLFRPLRYKVTS